MKNKEPSPETGGPAMNRWLKTLALVAFLSVSTFAFFSCEESKNIPPPPKETKAVVQPPTFNADSAFAYIAKQVSFGPRIPNTPGHIQCSDYLVLKLKKFGATVYEQDFQTKAFDGKLLRAKNVIGSFNPEAKKRLLLAAHWDTRPWSDEDAKFPLKPFDGANDGASGVGILLEIARIISQSVQKPSVGIDIILFDAEDYGKSGAEDSYCLGAQYWAKNKHLPNYSAYYGILLDMVGAKNASFNKEGVSMQYAPSIVNKVWDKASSLGYGNYFTSKQVGSITDDHYYVNKIAKIPMIDIIDYSDSDGFGDFWHTQEDNLTVIDKATLNAVGQTLLHVIYNE